MLLKWDNDVSVQRERETPNHSGYHNSTKAKGMHEPSKRIIQSKSTLATFSTTVLLAPSHFSHHRTFWLLLRHQVLLVKRRSVTVCHMRRGRCHWPEAYGPCFVTSKRRVLTFCYQQPFLQSLASVSLTFCDNHLPNLQAKVSSILTISRADVSMNPQPRLRAHSQPTLLETTRASWRSHLLPATIMTGGILHPSSRLPLTRVPFSRRRRLFSSKRFSASMLIMSRNHVKPSNELGLVISYTSKNASD